MTFSYPSRLAMAHTPTPIQPLALPTEKHNGPNLFVKRDDLTGCGLSGNKVRKLEFVVADAQQHHADTPITCGGVQSNHARATAVIAAQLGMASHLVLRGNPDTEADGNLLLARLVGADITFITADQYRDERDDIMKHIADQLRRQGRRPYVIPEGASDELGAWGYVAATEEIVHQLDRRRLRIDAVISATGSGGTLAGLIIGKALFQQSYDIYGINVCDDEAYFITAISTILDKFQRRFNLDLGLTASDVHIIDGYVGAGYAISRDDELKLIRDIARRTGIFLDPVYTGKTMYGLMDQIHAGRFSPDMNLLLLHSGGIFGLFPKRRQLIPLLS